MSFIAAGMESDFSDSDYDTMVFNYENSSDNKKFKKLESEFVAVSADYVAANGSFKPPPESLPITSQNTSSDHKMPSNSIHALKKKKNYYSVTSRKEPLDDLRYAIIQGNLDVIKSKFEEGIAVDCILKSGWTGLMYACSSAHDHIVEYLLDKGANPNYDKDHFTPLMAVCASTKPETTLLKCCQLLLKYDAKVNVHERHLTTPLMFAAREGHFQIMQELLKAGANVDKQDNRGRTALMWAASNGFGPIVRLLLNNGADPNIVDSFGQTAADSATHCDYSEIAALLEKLTEASEITDTKLEAESDNVQRKKTEVKMFPKNSYVNGNYQQNSKCYSKQNELEIFLTGLGFPELINVAKEHQLTFYQFIVLNEEELEKIGIDKIGVRKKIIEAAQVVHKEKWRRSSLPNMRRLPYISCPDAVAMVANIDEHLEHISSQIIYIRLQIQERPKILELAQDTANVHNLLEETEIGLKNVKTLYDELRFLKLYLNKIQGNNEFEAGDLIDDEDTTNYSSSKITFVFGIFIVSVTIGGIMWKKPESFAHINSFITSKIPFLK